MHTLRDNAPLEAYGGTMLPVRQFYRLRTAGIKRMPLQAGGATL